MTPPLPIDFQPYLAAILTSNDYQGWQDCYTPTTVEDRRLVATPQPGRSLVGRLPSRLKLRVETVKLEPAADDPSQPKDEQREKVEQWDVLAGLRHYAADHVVLIGKPGSGKSTSLKRLLWEEAERAQQDPIARIPVLVKLRRCTDSLAALIRDFLQQHRLALDIAQVEDCLRQGRFLLLLDGLNELPEAFRTAAANFRDRYRATTPMIFSTRDLAVGGVLGIQKTLKMLPLTEPQMREFVRGYLGTEGDRLFQQLQGDRLRKFAETPLLLWMLCRVFAVSGQVPSNLGLAFREFAQLHDQDLQADVPTDSRDQWPELLRHLAFEMMQGKTPTELRLSISQEAAADCLTTHLQEAGWADPRGCAVRWLQDLVKYHLIQPVIQPNFEQHLEFRHQLIQEYYSAEYLLRCLPQLSDEVLKRDYLNYLKWTEPVALMLALVEEEAQALRVVRLAMDEVDLMLGARLAGEVKPALQATTVGWLDQKELPIELKVLCWKASQSEASIEGLSLNTNNSRSFVRDLAAEALGLIGTEKAIDALLESVKKSNSILYMERAVGILEKAGGSKIINSLQRMLKHPKAEIRCVTSSLFGRIGSETVIDDLLSLLNDLEPKVQIYAARALGEICNKQGISSEQVTNNLIQLLYHPNSENRRATANVLGEIGHWRAINDLLAVLKDDSNPYVRMAAATALGDIGDLRAVDGLLLALKDPDSWVCSFAATSLGKVGGQQAVAGLQLALQSSDEELYQSAEEALRNIKGEISIDITDREAKENLIEQPEVTTKAWDAIFLRVLWESQLRMEHTVVYRAINATQRECQFYNYELWQAAESISTQPQPTNMTEKPEYNAKYVIHGNPTIVEKDMTVHGDHVGTKNIYNYFGADPALNQEIVDLQQLIASLEAANPNLKTEQEADQIVTTALNQVQTQEPTRWQKIRHQMGILKKQILNPERHLQAAKATAIEVAKDAVENSLIVKAVITYIDKLSETPDQGA